MEISGTENGFFHITPTHGHVITARYAHHPLNRRPCTLALFVVITRADGEPVALLHEHDVNDYVGPAALETFCAKLQRRAAAVEHGDQSRYDAARESLVVPSAFPNDKPRGIW